MVDKYATINNTRVSLTDSISIRNYSLSITIHAQIQHLLVPWIRRARRGAVSTIPGQRISLQPRFGGVEQTKLMGTKLINNTFDDATTMRFNDAKKTVMMGNIGLNNNNLKVANGASFIAHSDYGLLDNKLTASYPRRCGVFSINSIERRPTSCRLKVLMDIVPVVWC